MKKQNIALIVLIIAAAGLYAYMMNTMRPDCNALVNGDKAAQEMYVTYCK
jgi:VCBS repeat-containing protein